MFFCLRCYSLVAQGRCHESLSPHKTPPAGFAPTDLLSDAGSALLEKQRARQHALDVQRRKLTPRDGTLPRKASRDQTFGNLDDPGFDYLVSLRCAHVGRVSHFNTRARWRTRRGIDRAQ